jgi:hypothetical protein
MKKQLRIPKFKNEDEEIKFWSKIDLSEYFSPGDFGRVSFSNLKPTAARSRSGFQNISSTVSKKKPTQSPCPINP